MSGFSKILLGTALATVSAAAVAAEPPPAPGYETVEGLQVGIGRCSFAPERSREGQDRILAAIATAAISKGVNLLASAIADAGAAKTWKISGSRNFQATSNTFPQCVQVVRGKFYSNLGELGTWANNWKQEQRTALLENGLFLAEPPDFFFEGEFVASEDQTALAVRPVYSSFARPLGTRMLRSGKSRNIVVFLAITPPGTKPSLETAPAATIILGEHKPNTVKRYRPGGETYSSPLESPWFTFAKVDARKPFTVTALETETQGKNEFLAFVGAVVSDEKVKTAANTELTQLLIPSVRASAEATETNAEVTAENGADEKLGLAIAKLDACRTATSGVVTAGSAAKIALRNYWVADQALDEGSRANLVTQDQIDQLDLTRPQSIKQSCESVYQALTS
ncbi:MAG TPA: hypothetical protein VFR28_04380 [Allosphingosinicella sp.]|nr:hypothetical protein [Allosphingosinicella sp.]